MTVGAGIFITWRSIRGIRDSAWENVWWRNVSLGCARWEFSGQSFWWRTIIRADAIFGSAAVGKNCPAQWRWAKTCRPESQVKGQKYEVRKKSSFIPADLLYEAIVDSSDDAIVSKNLQSIVISWNKGAERIFGYTAEEMI